MAAPDPTEFGRKIRQHDNEFEAIYDLVRAVEGKIAALDTKVDTGFDALNTKVDALTTNFDALNTKVDALTTNFDALNTKVDTGFERLESTQRQILELLHGRDNG